MEAFRKHNILYYSNLEFIVSNKRKEGDE